MSENKKIPLNEVYQSSDRQQKPSTDYGYQPTTSTEERGYQPMASTSTPQGQSIPPTGGATIQNPPVVSSNKPKE